jgi:hypothetical protein
MVSSMQLLRCVAVLLLLGCNRAAAPAESAPAPPATAPASGSPGARFSQHCQYKLSQDTTLLACREREVLVILPGHDWQADDAAAVPGGLLFAESVPLRVSIVAAESGEGRYALGEHLTAVYDGLAPLLARQGFNVGKPHLEQMPNGHLVLAYELSGSIEGMAFRSVNAWTALKRSNGEYYDYHVSYTQPADHADWQDAAAVLRLTKKVADAFFVTDGRGNTPPQ